MLSYYVEGVHSINVTTGSMLLPVHYTGVTIFSVDILGVCSQVA